MGRWHRVLVRQLRKAGIQSGEDVSAAQMQSLLERIDRHYRNLDDERYTTNRSMEVSSQELARLNGRIQDAARRMEATLEALSEAVVQVDECWVIEYLNSRAKELLETAELGSNLWDSADLVSGAGRPIKGGTVRHLLQMGPWTDPDATLNGTPVRVSAAPLSGGGFVVGVRSLSDLTAARLEANRSRSAERARGNFLANMSHELRTPLNGILGYSEILAEDLGGPGFEAARQDLERIRSSGEHLLGLINGVLDLSKVDAGRMEVFVERFGVEELVAEVVGEMRPMIEKRGLAFEVQLAKGLGEMQSDRRKVRQCLTNLLGNAVKFTEVGSVSLRVTRQGGELCIEVADTGIGVRADRIPLLFDAFTQADASTTRHYGGTGLGLTLTRAFAELLQGSVEVESEEGVGSRFRLRVATIMAES